MLTPAGGRNPFRIAFRLTEGERLAAIVLAILLLLALGVRFINRQRTMVEPFYVPAATARQKSEG